MDQRERSGDQTEVLRAALDGRQAKLWTAMPGIVQSFDPVAMTCVVQPSTQAKQSFRDSPTVSLVTFPLLLDCPAIFPCGGGCTLTFPVSPGDECLIIIASRCIDGWFQSGGVQAPVVDRMHDLSDGFALLGVRSQPRVIAGISTVSAQLRSDDGSTSIDLNPTSGKITLTSPVPVQIDAPDLICNGISLVNHLHTEVQTGGDNTGPATG